MAATTYTITLMPPLQGVSPGPPRLAHGPFAGMAIPALQAALSQAQAALIAVVTGSQAVTVEYAEGQGRRHVSYTRANADQLRRLILDLQAALGARSRRPIIPVFGG